MTRVLADPQASSPLQEIADRIVGMVDGQGQGVNFIATDRLLAAADIDRI